jgi:hypothetical protein
MAVAAKVRYPGRLHNQSYRRRRLGSKSGSTKHATPVPCTDDYANYSRLTHGIEERSSA